MDTIHPVCDLCHSFYTEKFIQTSPIKKSGDDVTKTKFVKLSDWLAHPEKNKMKNLSLAKNQPVGGDISNFMLWWLHIIPLKQAWIVNVAIQANIMKKSYGFCKFDKLPSRKLWLKFPETSKLLLTVCLYVFPMTLTFISSWLSHTTTSSSTYSRSFQREWLWYCDKIPRAFSSNGITWENKIIYSTPLPSPVHTRLACSLFFYI